MRILKNKTACNWAITIWMILTLANFLVFAVIALHLGGTAVNGKISDSHFFWGSHSHYTEVSRQVFNYSKWHVYSVYFTFALSFVAAFLVGRYGKRKAR